MSTTASPKRHLTGISDELTGLYDGELKTIPADGALVFECEIRNPPSRVGQTIYVFFTADMITEAMKLFKDEAIRARSKPMTQGDQ